MSIPFAEFALDNVRIVGGSVAGEESCILAPDLNLAFDVGRAPRELITIDNVFLSHGHMDHAAGIAYYFSQRMFIDNQPGSLFLPAGLGEPVRKLLQLWAEIDGHEPPGNITEVTPGQDVPLRRDLVVRPFAVNHPCRRRRLAPVTALGYAAIEVRNKLKDEFQHLEGPQLVELKKKGIEITRRVEMPLVAYCGDTADGAFLDLDHVRNARILLLECTFVEDDHVDRARAGYHLHISDLPAILPRLANERILLTHLSRRTPLPDARRRLRALLGDDQMERVSFLMDHRRRRRGPGSREPRAAGDADSGDSEPAHAGPRTARSD